MPSLPGRHVRPRCPHPLLWTAAASPSGLWVETLFGMAGGLSDHASAWLKGPVFTHLLKQWWHCCFGVKIRCNQYLLCGIQLVTRKGSFELLFTFLRILRSKRDSQFARAICSLLVDGSD